MRRARWAPRGAAWLLLWVSLGGCSDRPSIASGAAAIIGGVPDDEHRAVIAILIRSKSGDESLCSALVIAPRVALSAAHCLAPVSVGAGAVFSLFVGSDVNQLPQQKASENTILVERVIVDPEFEPSNLALGHDLALAIATRPLPVAPPSIDPAPALQGVTHARIVGYGVTTVNTDDDGGRRRQAVASIAGYDQRFIELGGKGPMPCAGDSGGAVFTIDKKEGRSEVSGLISYTNSSCTSVRATRLRAYLPFIRTQVAAVEAAEGGCRLEPPGGERDSTLLFLLLILTVTTIPRRRRG